MCVYRGGGRAQWGAQWVSYVSQAKFIIKIQSENQKVKKKVLHTNPILSLSLFHTHSLYTFLTLSLSTVHSGGIIPGLGRTTVHHGAQGALRIQRESLHFHGDLQRIPAHLLPQCVHVSSAAYTLYPIYVYIFCLSAQVVSAVAR